MPGLTPIAFWEWAIAEYRLLSAKQRGRICFLKWGGTLKDEVQLPYILVTHAWPYGERFLESSLWMGLN